MTAAAPSQAVIVSPAQFIEVQNAYVSLLGRPADPGGLDYWASVLASGQSLSKIMQSIIASSEYIQQESQDIIDNVYKNLFGRIADQAGKDFFLEKQQKENLSIPELVKQIVDAATGIDQENKEAKLDAAQKMSQLLKEQMMQAEREKIDELKKAQEEAIERMKEALRGVDSEKPPTQTDKEIQQIIKDTDKAINPDPDIIEVPVPVPSTIKLTLGTGIDEVDIGSAKATITVRLNADMDGADSLDWADSITNFNADDRIYLGPLADPLDFKEILVVDADDLWQRVNEGEFENSQLLYAYQADGDAWLLLMTPYGDIENAVKLVGLGQGDVTATNILAG